MFASRARGVWDVGIGHNKKNRPDAWKVALAGSIAALCIFASRARGVWAVGIGNKKKNRTDAGKVALAASIAAMSIVHNEPPPENLQSYPAFVSCLREVKRLVG
jgi:hypothetical protein